MRNGHLRRDVHGPLETDRVQILEHLEALVVQVQLDHAVRHKDVATPVAGQIQQRQPRPIGNQRRQLDPATPQRGRRMDGLNKCVHSHVDQVKLLQHHAVQVQ